MKKISILFYLVLSLVTFISCEEQDEINSLDAMEPNITITQKSQINLNTKTFSKEEVENNLCGETTTDCELWAGQNIDAGNISVGNDEEYLYVKVYSESGFQNTEENIKMWIGTDLPSKRPAAGQFPKDTKVTVTGNSHTFKMLLSSLDNWVDDQCEQSFKIILHADVLVDNNGSLQAETAFGGCETGAGKAWWYYMDYTTSCCKGSDDDNDNNDESDEDGSGDTGDDNDGDNNDDTTATDNCLSAFAYTDKSYCFTYTDSEEVIFAGWSNEFNFYEQQREEAYILPLYAKIDECIDPAMDPDGIQIGHVEIFLFSEGVGDGMQLYTTVKYVIDTAYALSDVNLHLQQSKYPYNLDPSNGDYNYDETDGTWDTNTNTFTFEKLPWPGYYNDWNTYFIPNIVVCKVNTTN